MKVYSTYLYIPQHYEAIHPFPAETTYHQVRVLVLWPHVRAQKGTCRYFQSPHGILSLQQEPVLHLMGGSQSESLSFFLQV